MRSNFRFIRLSHGTSKYEPTLGHIPTWSWAIIFLLASALSLLIPPMQSPDEVSHVTRAYLISQGQFLLTPPTPELRDLSKKYANNKIIVDFIERTLESGGRTGGMVDQGLIRYADLYAPLPGQPAHTLTKSDNQRAAAIQWGEGEEYYVMPGTGYYLPLIYTPQATGLLLGRLAGLSVDRSYRLARGFTLLMCLVLLRAAFSRLAPNALVLGVLLLPMSVFQMLAPTLDGLTSALAILTISIFLSAWRTSQNLEMSTVFAVCVLLLATTRNQLIPLLILPFCLAIKHKSRQEMYLGLAVCVAVFSWTLFVVMSVNDSRVVRSHTTAELLIHYAQHPFSFLNIVIDSVSRPDIFNFYQRSFIGILGALDTPLQDNLYSVLWFGLFACFIVSAVPYKSYSDIPARAALAFTGGASTLMVFLALLVTWTPHPASVINGIQGRYFVVPVMLFGYALANDTVNTTVHPRKLSMCIIISFAGVSLFALISALFSRYP